jgi:hypothetical protein
VRSPSERSGALRDPGGVANIIVAFHGQAGYWSKRLCSFLSSGIGGSRRRNSLSLRKEQLDDYFRSCSLDTKDW